MRGATYVRFYPSDWRSGCIGLSLEQEGLYIRICAYIYETGQRLALDDSKAAKFLGVHTNAYRRYRDQLADLGKLLRTDAGWTVRRVEKELAAAMGATQRSDGAPQEDGGAAVETVADTVPNTLTNTPTITPHNTPTVFSKNNNEISGSIKSQEPVSKKEKKVPHTPRDRGGRLSSDWSLPDEWRQWARLNFVSVEPVRIEKEAEKFADYWHAQPGSKGRKSDWLATWRNWCRTAFEGGRNGQPMNWGRNAHDQAKAAELERYRRESAAIIGSRA